MKIAEIKEILTKHEIAFSQDMNKTQLSALLPESVVPEEQVIEGVDAPVAPPEPAVVPVAKQKVSAGSWDVHGPKGYVRTYSVENPGHGERAYALAKQFAGKIGGKVIEKAS